MLKNHIYPHLKLLAAATMMHRRYFYKGLLFGVVSLCFLTGAPAQEVHFGTPPIWNFPKKAYRAGTQNWDAAQDKRGVLYWANNEGLLQYDGTHWTCLPVANQTIVRAVAIDAAGRIFTGAQSEFGYFFPEKNGCLRYQSLVSLLPEAQRSFEDVWDIVFWGEDVFFRTNRVVFQYTKGRIHTYTAKGALTALFTTPKGVVIQQDFSTLLRFQNDTFEPYIEMPALQSPITGTVRWAADTLLLTSLKHGIFYLSSDRHDRWATPHDARLMAARIYTSTALPNGHLALGSSLEGLIVLDRQRRISWHLTKKTGLQNNNILHAFSDRAGNVWLGLDSGIDCAVLDSPFSTLIPDGDLHGTGYAAALFQNQLYLGVSNGVYRASWATSFPPQEAFFKKIEGTDGQVWSLKAQDNTLLMGHHEGAFSLKGQGVERLSAEPGAWTFVPLSADYLLGGTYSGLVLYRKSVQGWVFDRKIAGLTESCRIMVKDADGLIWISHPYRGLYRVEWSPERKNDLNVKFFNTANGLPSNLNNYVFQIASKAVFTTEKGVYRYDRSTASFVPDEDFNRMLAAQHRIKYLREDVKGNIWYVTEQEVGVLMIDDLGVKKEVRKKVFPELAGKLVGGFEFIYPMDETHVIFGTEQGFIYYNMAPPPMLDTVLQVILSHISADGAHKIVLLGPCDSNNEAAESQAGALPVLEARNNNLTFAFSATDYKNPALLQYRVKLVGWQQDWSEWSSETKRDYTNLSPGDYTFQVQARRKDVLESAVVSYSFRIRPPWYKSTAALLLYALGFAGLFYGFLFRQRQKFETEKAQMAVTHQKKEAQHLLAVAQSKDALIQMGHEKLEAEIQFKNKELASTTMHLVQKGEILLTVQEALNQILEKSLNAGVKKEIQQLLNLLNFDAKLDEDWEQFAFHFDQVHVDFLKQLREQFPQLSTNDHKLCAYLRMNLSTKEIAPLLNISVRGVEGSRYRLRKKLNLPNDANLTDFIMGLGAR